MPLWGGCDIQDINRLQILQNRVVQLDTKHPPRTHRNIMFDKIDWSTVRQMVVYTTLLAVFKIRKSGEPEFLAAKLRRESRNGRIMIENTKLQMVQDGFGVQHNGICCQTVSNYSRRISLKLKLNNGFDLI